MILPFTKQVHTATTCTRMQTSLHSQCGNSQQHQPEFNLKNKKSNRIDKIFIFQLTFLQRN